MLKASSSRGVGLMVVVTVLPSLAAELPLTQAKLTLVVPKGCVRPILKTSARYLVSRALCHGRCCYACSAMSFGPEGGFVVTTRV
eukprot:2033078-Rhodomonas_salina.2